jgi:DNA replication and repair protein RecF
MLLRSLYLHRFRNYEEAFVEFDPNFNLICGPNAQGKTNILEAIHYLMMGRSFRPSQSVELIKHGTSSFYLEGTFLKHSIEQKLRLIFDGKERKMIYNSTPLPTVSSLLGLIQGVILTPDDVNLIKGPPLLRRQFLDIQIAQVDPLYVHHLTRYARAMRQRNQLLKIHQQMTIDSWEHEMGQSAAYITLQRYRTVEDLQLYCRQIHPILTGESQVLGIAYKTSYLGYWQLEELRQYFLEQFKKNRLREMGLGHTIIGPHKDDLLITIGEKDIRYFASEGQQRSCVTALHFAEWQRLQQIGDVTPLMMIDDVGMGLDVKRRSYLIDQLAQLGQVFLTTTDENLLEHRSRPIKTFRIQEGKVSN